MNSPTKDVFRVEDERVLEAIKQACLKRTNCGVCIGPSSPDESGERSAQPSMLLHSDRTPGGTGNDARYIVVAVPPHDAEPKPGDMVEVRFEYEGRSLIFYAPYEGPTTFTSPASVKLDAWQLRYPSELYQIQRRGFFRIRATLNTPVKVDIALTGNSVDLTDDAGKALSHRMAAVVDRQAPEPDETTGILWDISGGGISFTLEPEPSFQLSPGAYIEFSMSLPGVAELLELKGEITTCKFSAGLPTLYCVEFRGLEDEARLRRSHNLVLQYIAQREREMLKDLRMAKRWSSGDSH